MLPEEIQVFQKLLDQDGFKGKKQLRHVMWMNTHPPQYKIGDCYLLPDPKCRVFGRPVKNIKARITSFLCYMGDHEWMYHLEADVRRGSKQGPFKIHLKESDLTTAIPCEGNFNDITATKPKEEKK